MESFLDWRTAAGIGAAASFLLPLVIYTDWRKHGRTLTRAAYWNSWLGMNASLLAAIIGLHAWHATGIPGLVGGIGGLALGLSAGFWYFLLLECCLRVLGAIVPDTQSVPSP